MTGKCRCGHLADAHLHYRRGSDCAVCDCAGFRVAVAGRVAWMMFYLACLAASGWMALHLALS